MKVIFILTLLIPIHLYAQEEICHYDHGLIGKELTQLLDWFGAGDKQVSEAPCKTKTVPLEKDMLNFIAKKAGNKSVKSEEVQGVIFKDENPALIEAFKDFTVAFDSIGNAKSEEQIEIQKKFQINPECDKVLCAIKKIWGENAIKMLYIKMKHHYNTSEIAFSHSERFSSKELDDVLLSLEDIPDHLDAIGKRNQRLTRFKEGYTLESYGPEVVANAVIMLFDSWKDKSSPSRQYTIFHEVSHNLAGRLNGMDYHPEWLELSEWVKKGDDWSSKKDACFSSEYAMTNPAEDFAETATTYRYNGKELKESCPKKYDFMKNNVFKGIEYSEERLCAPVSKTQLSYVRKQVGKDLLNLLSSQKYSNEQIEENCLKNFHQYPVTQEEVASCALNIQLKTNLRPRIKQSMEASGIVDTGFQEELLLKTLIEDLNKDEGFIETVLKHTSSLEEEVNSSVEKEIRKIRETPILDSELEIAWYSASRQCGTLLLSSSDQEIIDCYVKGIIAQDESNRSWKEGFLPSFTAPAAFSGNAQQGFNEIRENILLEILRQNPKIAAKQKSLKKDFKFNLERHFRDVSQGLKKIPDWKQMDPKTFCEMTYGKPTIWLSSYGFKQQENIKDFINKCIEIQSRKSKRFELNSNHSKEIVK